MRSAPGAAQRGAGLLRRRWARALLRELPLDAACPDCRARENEARQGHRRQPAPGLRTESIRRRTYREVLECPSCKTRSAGGMCPYCGERLIEEVVPCHETPGGPASEETLDLRAATVSRRLGAVADVDPRLCAALEAYWGEVGRRWALDGRSRACAVYKLTPSGHALLAAIKARTKKWAGKTPEELLAEEMRAQDQRPDEERGDLFATADEQAAEPIEQVARAWNEASCRQAS